MKSWRSRLIVLVIVALSAAGIGYAWGRAKRELGYSSTLRSYSTALKPGISRQEVEDYLQAKSISVGQICCFNEHGTFSDAVTIGEEKVFLPLCNKEQVIVVFEFAAREPHDSVQSHASDELKRLFLWRPMQCV
jgi:hypothetical protein